MLISWDITVVYSNKLNEKDAEHSTPTATMCYDF